MATVAEKKMNKTTFLAEFLKSDPTATSTDASQAWMKAGNNGTISPTLVSNLRARLGLAGKVRARSATTRSAGKKAATTRPRAASSRNASGTTRTRVATRGKTDQGEQVRATHTVKGASPGKSSFIKEILFDNPLANPATVNAAWKTAGMKGTISDSLVNKIRSDLGLSGNLRHKSAPASGNGTGKTSAPQKPSARAGQTARTEETPDPRTPGKKGRPSNRSRSLAEIEGDIDRLIFKLMVVGGLEKVEDELRRVRRHVIRTHQA